MTFTTDDLPAPLGPSSPKNCPGWRLKETSSTAKGSWARYRLRRSTTSTSASTAHRTLGPVAPGLCRKCCDSARGPRRACRHRVAPFFSDRHRCLAATPYLECSPLDPISRIGSAFEVLSLAVCPPLPQARDTNAQIRPASCRIRSHEGGDRLPPTTLDKTLDSSTEDFGDGDVVLHGELFDALGQGSRHTEAERYRNLFTALEFSRFPLLRISGRLRCHLLIAHSFLNRLSSLLLES